MYDITRNVTHGRFSIYYLLQFYDDINILIIIYAYIFVYKHTYIYTQSTPDKSDSQGTEKSVRFSEMSDLSDIQNIMQIRLEMRNMS